MPSRRPSAEQVRAALGLQLAELGRPLPPPGPGRSDLAQLQAACVDAALDAFEAGQPGHREAVGVAVRYLLGLLAAAAPGKAVEVRVPPFGAVQCVAGPRHGRGTPPNVVEMAPKTWIRLAAGRMSWDEAADEAALTASGSRADLKEYLHLMG